ncbi:hypothetical protein E2562_023618 [Oryza meyeriana var. granulata]|uniref:Pectinesterase inhibitor domain-containing protein n=1 Tax=Oryza meyeriana var. granulata TaxID=110450 RepID=A0A6G1FBG1_9ORYZ|nr:hypothetical protein E2562_023618 [Oryza meyeriana var. granulata]
MVMLMNPYTAGFLAVVLALSGVVDGTVVTTCRAAADRDGRVDYDFCVAELGKHHDSPSADAWGLAKVAALTGVVDADNAVYDVKDLLARKGAGDAGAALARCEELYGAAGFAFAEAHDDINGRDYAAGKDKAADAASLARQCNGAFADKDAVPPVIGQHSSYAARIAIVCTAITNLIE